MKWFVLLLLLPVPIHAANYASIHLESNHSVPGKYNERNIGIGMEIDRPGYWRIVLGAYDNSYGDLTGYVGPMYGTDHIAIGAIFLTGYNNEIDADHSLPSPAPMIRIRPLSTKVSPSFTLTPISGGYVVLTSMDWKF